MNALAPKIVDPWDGRSGLDLAQGLIGASLAAGVQ